MKKKILIWLFAFTFMFSGITVYASGNSNDLTAAIEGVKDKLSEAFSEMDQDTAKDVFTFVKEKVSEGSLKSEEGLKAAIEEGEAEFNVTINESDAKKVVDTMEKLEDLGFDSEYVIEKAENLYDEYGAEFVDHADEVVTGAVKNAVGNVVQEFFKGIWESIKSFFTGIFN